MSARVTLTPNAAATATAVSAFFHLAVRRDGWWFASWSISSPRRGDMPDSARGRVSRQFLPRPFAGGAVTAGQGIRQLTTDSSERVRSAYGGPRAPWAEAAPRCPSRCEAAGLPKPVTSGPTEPGSARSAPRYAQASLPWFPALTGRTSSVSDPASNLWARADDGAAAGLPERPDPAGCEPTEPLTQSMANGEARRAGRRQ